MTPNVPDYVAVMHWKLNHDGIRRVGSPRSCGGTPLTVVSGVWGPMATSAGMRAITVAQAFKRFFGLMLSRRSKSRRLDKRSAVPLHQRV